MDDDDQPQENKKEEEDIIIKKDVLIKSVELSEKTSDVNFSEGEEEMVVDNSVSSSMK